MFKFHLLVLVRAFKRLAPRTHWTLYRALYDEADSTMIGMSLTSTGVWLRKHQNTFTRNTVSMHTSIGMQYSKAPVFMRDFSRLEISHRSCIKIGENVITYFFRT